MADNGRVAPSMTTGDVGAVIRAIRRENDQSAEDVCRLATKAGYPVRVPSLFQWEQGHRAIPLASLPYLAKALGTTPAALVQNMNCRKTNAKKRRT